MSIYPAGTPVVLLSNWWKATYASRHLPEVDLVGSTGTVGEFDADDSTYLVNLDRHPEHVWVPEDAVHLVLHPGDRVRVVPELADGEVEDTVAVVLDTTPSEGGMAPIVTVRHTDTANTVRGYAVEALMPDKKENL